MLERFTALGLLFHDGDSYLQVAVESDNQVLMRMRHRHGPAAARPARPARPGGPGAGTETEEVLDAVPIG